MDIVEIRASGLLELYVMDQLTPAEKAEVNRYVQLFPELRQDLLEIENSLELLSRSVAKPVPTYVKERIIAEIRPSAHPGIPTLKKFNRGTTTGVWRIAAMLLGAAVMGIGYLYTVSTSETKVVQHTMTLLLDSCEQNANQLTTQLRLLQQLIYPENKIIPFSPTPAYATTDLYFHHNTMTKRNFIQVRSLPPKSDQEQYQLWALKPNRPPEPLDVFDVPSGGLIEVRYIDDTPTYAITIEVRGGRNTPTLEHLIGTVSIGE